MDNRRTTAPAPGRTALVAGATGLVGREILALLLADKDYAAVHCIGRRAPPLSDARLHAHVAEPAQWADLRIDGLTDVFIALGTTIKVAGSQSAFRAVDFDSVVAVAKAGRTSGAINLGVVSAMGASSSSPVFYNRVKGDMESSVQALGYTSVVIARPSFIEGDRAALQQPGRAGEGLALVAMRWLRPVTPANYRSVSASAIARSLVRRVKQATPGVHTVLSGDLQAG